jgi:hypothetical protein
MKLAGPAALLLAILLAGCSLAGDITPPPALATAQAGETLPPATRAPTEPPETPAATLSVTTVPAEPGTIRGVVANGTPGGPAPAGIEVRLSGFDGDQEEFQQTTVTAADGSFVFSDVPVVTGRIYGVTASYGDVLYYSEGAHLIEGEAAPELPVTVYEATSDTDALSVERLHVLFDFPAANQVQVVELWVLSNSGDRTVVAESGRAVVEVALPEGATGLAFEDNSVADRYLQTADGFGDTEPILPGQGMSQFIFSYWLPYDGGLTFSRRSDYPVNAVVVLLPQNGIRAEGAGLRDLGVQDVGGEAVQAFEGGAIAAGQALEVKLSGRPAGAEAASTINWNNLGVGLGLLVVLLAGAGAWWFRRSRAAPEGQADPTESLLDAIAELDEALEAGRIEATEHHRRREALKRELRQRMR